MSCSVLYRCSKKKVHKSGGEYGIAGGSISLTGHVNQRLHELLTSGRQPLVKQLTPVNSQQSLYSSDSLSDSLKRKFFFSSNFAAFLCFWQNLAQELGNKIKFLSSAAVKLYLRGNIGLGNWVYGCTVAGSQL